VIGNALQLDNMTLSSLRRQQRRRDFNALLQSHTGIQYLNVDPVYDGRNDPRFKGTPLSHGSPLVAGWLGFAVEKETHLDNGLASLGRFTLSIRGNFILKCNPRF
jgi:hypothetical protein